jgi:hypothetical protein
VEVPVSDEATVYTPDDEPIMHRVARALKHAFGGGTPDTNLPDEGEDTPRRRAEFAREQSDDTIKKLQKVGEGIRKTVSGELVRQYKNQGMSEEDAVKTAIRRR